MRLFLSFAAAVLSAALVASIFSSQLVVAGLQDVGADINMSARIRMTLDDLAIIKAFAALMSLCFLIGFLLARFLRGKLGGSRTLWLACAGAASWLSTLLIMSYVLQLMPVAGARSVTGLLLQALAGGIGGAVFARLSTKLARETQYD